MSSLTQLPRAKFRPITTLPFAFRSFPHTHCTQIAALTRVMSSIHVNRDAGVLTDGSQTAVAFDMTTTDSQHPKDLHTSAL